MSINRRKIAIIVAGGSGVRMGSSIPKQFLPLAGKPVLAHTIQAFANAYEDMEIILVLPLAHFDYARDILEGFNKPPRVQVIAGGDTRFHSVKNGLDQVKGDAVIFVHDGVRPLVTAALIHRCYEAALQYGSAIPVVPMKDSIRVVHENGNAAADRDRYKIVQTPQTFSASILIPAFEQPYDPLFTDEASVVETAGHAIHLVTGDPENIKITQPQDLVIAAALLGGH
ncbi:2-C-methyl-D-erythritol 4-phosphate cytidylyltransferase [Chitinophaga costaii]|uniref:2-C-methyl-D-erythritol 4-phosphate cytidylyltransferase n=1 Tax=Chitinophaga costaii TaxID=1335309 RepID=A0A1C3ZYW6_9BACT|nr:2-C-methyl-D-erythritol 4-phosphate cytidylyltransferase [Chitinophaga costaii]PUZ30561.1 2-C-methyl-D-erythritol 4-phosphate cytidylyltransferase [Chitinophaga costaii]SCB87485.1 2-C-methyl-D-erythritol 4-phosphate cytidylyltransferase [Chitinophaga costaii]